MTRRALFLVGFVAAYPIGVGAALVLHHVNLYRITRRRTP